jgi:hypothetical protein
MGDTNFVQCKSTAIFKSAEIYLIIDKETFPVLGISRTVPFPIQKSRTVILQASKTRISDRMY